MEPTGDPIRDYIRANRDRYTRDAMREELIKAGHAAENVDRAFADMAADPAAGPVDRGWRPGWREFFVLIGLGAVGAVLVWMDEAYGGGFIAPIVYLILAPIAFAIGKALSLLVDAGNVGLTAVLLAIAAIGGATLSVINGVSIVALSFALLAGIPALLLIFLRRSNPRGAGPVGAAIPIIAWLALTGWCYTPLFTRLGGV